MATNKTSGTKKVVTAAGTIVQPVITPRTKPHRESNKRG